MRFFHTASRKAAVAAVAAVAAAGAGGTAYAASSSGTPGPSSAGGPVSTSRSLPRTPRSLLERTDHATIEVKVKGQWVTYALDRGRVTAVSPTSITLARPDGQSVTDTIGPGTRYRGVSSESEVQLNRPATVVSEAGTAIRIGQPPVAGGGTAGGGTAGPTP